MQGVDFRKLTRVIQYGICADQCDNIQRGGRTGRDLNDWGLFLMMFEDWVDEVDISEVPAEELDEDPDRPFELTYKKYPTKLERTGIHSIQTLQSSNKNCLRKIFAEYLNDSTSTGMFIIKSCLQHL
jgi:superfamily II DNA/RNA helicase